MTRDYFLNTVKDQYRNVGSRMYEDNSKFIFDEMNSSRSEVIKKVQLTKLEKGKFYFIFYDISGKTSKMEKFSPILLLDWYDMNSTRYYFGLCLNFLPITIRISFFNNLLNFNLDVIDDNSKTELDKEKALNNITFSNIYKLLSSIGFEWAIRKFDIKLINVMHEVSMKNITQFIPMSTYRYTGVDDNKLVDIWKKKINDQQKRHEKIINEILSDYKTLQQELQKNYKTITEKTENLEETINIIKNNF